MNKPKSEGIEMLNQNRFLALLFISLIISSCGEMLPANEASSQNGAKINSLFYDDDSGDVEILQPTPIPGEIYIAYPAAHASVLGTVSIRAGVSMAAGVDHVEFYLDHWATNSLMASVKFEPYEISWNTALAAPGIHTLGVRAYDKIGNFIQEAHDVVVGNKVTIVSPIAQQIVSGSVVISANALMPVGVDRVEFYRDYWHPLNLLGSVSAAPFEITLNTIGMDNGLHTIGVQAYDKWGNVVLAAHDVIVDNVVNPTSPPNAPVLFFVSLQGPSSIHLSWYDAATNEQAYVVERAIAGGSFSVLATLPGNSHQYDDTGLASATSYQYRVKAVNAAGSSAYTTIVTRTTP